MITRKKPEKFRLRRTMMFMNAQKPSLIKDAKYFPKTLSEFEKIR